MTAVLDQRRRSQVAWVAALAAIAAILSALAFGLDAKRRAPPDSPGLAAPALAARPAAAEVIVIITAATTYRLANDPRGWTMKDRGGYPVRQEAVAAFTQALSTLRFGRAMTRDPDKHARLGLDDPRAGGQGTLIQVQNLQGALLAELIVGQVGEAQYVRAAGAAQTWTAEGGRLPPMREAAVWLDLRPVVIAAERIARLDVARAEGVYALARGAPGEAFRLSGPGADRPVIEPARLGRVATALSALEPADVAPAPDLAGEPTARLVLQTVDGLALDAEAFDRDGRVWVRLSARATTPERAEEAAALNRRAAPWAFALSPEAAGDLAPPLSTLVRQPPPAQLRLELDDSPDAAVGAEAPPPEPVTPPAPATP